jgi:hypothetical protein
LRMRLFPESATYTIPLASTATPEGLKKEAATPAPSANAPTPLPASVLTTPPGVTARTRWLFVSATNKVPPEPTATPEGEKKEAPVPVPSANAGDPLPASVLTTPPGVTARTRLLNVSATNTVPLASMATP